jgi:predicted RNase H-like HicB family nuclease
MEYVYPAIFHTNPDGSYTITFPDLPGCISEGKSLENALDMAHSALYEWLEYCKDKKLAVPKPSAPQTALLSQEEFSCLVRVDVKYGRAVKRTVSIPQWMDEKVSESGLSLSRVLQEALLEKIG